MSNIEKLFYKKIFKNSWFDFGTIVLLNIVAGLIIANYEIHILVQICVVLSLLYRSFIVHVEYSVMPGANHDFSWKYLQALPLNKKQLIRCLSVGEFLSYISFFSWGIAFYPRLVDLFSDEKTVSLNTFFLQLSWAVILVYLFCISSIRGQIELPRRQYSTQDPKTKYYFYLKTLVLGAAFALYLIVAFRYWGAHSDLGFEKNVKAFFREVFEIVTSWWMIPILLSVVYYKYHRLLKIWQFEKLSYEKLVWVNRIQIPQVLGGFLVFVFGLFYFDFNTDLLFAGDKVLSAVSGQDYVKLEKVLNKTYKSKFNVTPYYVAAYNGDYEMFKYLEIVKSHLTLDEVNRKESSFHNTNIVHAAIHGGDIRILKRIFDYRIDFTQKPKARLSYLQYAARLCRPEMIEYLLTKNFDINEVNDEGNSALHEAATKNCFGSVVALVEAGADQKIKNKKGKLAAQLIKSSRDTGLAYYFQVKNRAPASKK